MHRSNDYRLASDERMRMFKMAERRTLESLRMQVDMGPIVDLFANKSLLGDFAMNAIEKGFRDLATRRVAFELNDLNFDLGRRPHAYFSGERIYLCSDPTIVTPQKLIEK
jgi:hypothetical protein